jgi:hypothetical protein
VLCREWGKLRVERLRRRDERCGEARGEGKKHAGKGGRKRRRMIRDKVNDPTLKKKL